MKSKNVLKILFALSVALSIGGVLNSSHSRCVSASDSINLYIDTLGFGNSQLPNGYVGKTYPVFNYQALDNSGHKINNTRVMVFSPENTILPLKNNRFDTNTEGTYKIEYFASNGDENITKTLEITVLPSSEYSSPNYIINDEIVSSADTGSLVLLPGGTIIGDNVSLELSVKYKTGLYSSTPYIETETETPYFVPKTEGVYSLVYTLTDFVGEIVEVEKEINVSDSEYPILNVPSISKVAHVGFPTVFPVAEAVLYRDGSQIYVPVKVDVNGQDITNSLSYIFSDVGNYTVSYSSANIYDTNKVSTYSETITVLDKTNNGEPYSSKYFAFDNMELNYRSEVDDLENYVTILSASSTAEKASCNFKTAIREELLSVSVGTDGSVGEFGSLVIEFVDSKHADEKVSILLKENNEKRIDVLLNNKKVLELNKTFTYQDGDFNQSALTIKYDYKNKALVDDEDELIAPLSMYDDGRKFEGFSSKSVYLTLAMMDVNESSRLKLYKIAGQTISGSAIDTLDPMMIYADDFYHTLNADINEEVTVGYMEVFDLYDSNPSLTMTITSPTGRVIYNGDVKPNYSFIPNEYGVYSIKYVAKDNSRREKTLRAVIQVIDRIAPLLSLNGYLSKNVKLNNEYELPTATVSDNYSEVFTWISIKHESSLREFVNNNKFIFTKTGIYTITYGAEDAAGNKTLVSYEVECK